MRIPRRDERPKGAGSFVAAEDAARRLEEAAPQVDRAGGVEWYEPGSDVDLAALTLCRLRRARAGEKGGPSHGDEAVREALARARPEAVVWIASRAISYMDENGFPQAVELWFPDD
jgi:hypothetical protein